MKKKIVAIIMFVVILVFPLLSWPLVSKYSKVTIDENRVLAEKPKFSLNFFSDFDDYFLDNAPYRSLLIKTYNKINNKLGDMYAGLMDLFKIPYYKSIRSVVFGTNDWLFYQADDSLSYYRGTNHLSQSYIDDYVQRAEKVNNYFKSLGKEMVIFLAPNKEIIYSEYMPKGIYVENQIRRNDIVADNFAKNSNVNFIYAKEALLNAKEFGQIYFRQDTHWNELGAYYGALEIFKKLNIIPGEAKINVNESLFNSDLSKMLNQDGVLDYAYDVNYRPEVEIQSYQDENGNLISTTSNKNGKNLLILGDSFRYSLIKILFKEFENSKEKDITMLLNNKSYYEEIKNEMNKSNVIILESVERFDTRIYDTLGILIELYDL